MITLALCASLVMQDSNLVISPRVRAMLDRFPTPVSSGPSIMIRFSHDTVWLGEQVELVTVTWFPKALRNRLRHQPNLTSPALTGLWSVRNQQLPIPVGTRVIGGQLFDMYVSWQTIFPLGGGRIEAPPAVLMYNLPTSTSYFAPEERKTVRSATTTLIVRPVPPALTAALGTGPTARNLHLAWRSPVATLHAGSPAIVELAISGEGNLALWPTPQVAWPQDVHVYAEPTEQHLAPVQGLITGEKRFRFTIVSDSAGVITLPAVSYPYFDPGAQVVEPAMARALSLAILPRGAELTARRVLAVTGSTEIPLAATIVRRWFPVLLLLALLPPIGMMWLRRRRVPAVVPPIASDPEAALRTVLGTPVEAGQDHVVAALRVRGVPREEAEHVHRWLSAVGRWRYGAAQRTEAPPTPPAVVSEVISRLRRGVYVALALLAVLPLHAQRGDAVTRYTGRDYAGAARLFGDMAKAEPLAAAAWRDLGSARWMQDDDVGATAAWLHALALAPRDGLLRTAWNGATGIPADVRGLAPTIPLSRDELLLVALFLWLVAWVAGARHWRRVAWVAGAVCAAALVLGLVRWQAERPGQVFVVASTPMRISPHPATMTIGELPAWTRVSIRRVERTWVLVDGQVNTAGGVGLLSIHGWIPAASVAPIGPLD